MALTPTDLVNEADAQLSALIGAAYDVHSASLQAGFLPALANALDLWIDGGTGLSGTLPGGGFGGGGSWSPAASSLAGWDGSSSETTYAVSDFAAASDLSTHTGDTSNPHAVTAAQLSLVIGTDVQAWDADLDAWPSNVRSMSVGDAVLFDEDEHIPLAGRQTLFWDVGPELTERGMELIARHR